MRIANIRLMIILRAELIRHPSHHQRIIEFWMDLVTQFETNIDTIRWMLRGSCGINNEIDEVIRGILEISDPKSKKFSKKNIFH